MKEGAGMGQGSALSKSATYMFKGRLSTCRRRGGLMAKLGIAIAYKELSTLGTRTALSCLAPGSIPGHVNGDFFCPKTAYQRVLACYAHRCGPLSQLVANYLLNSHWGLSTRKQFE